MYQYKTPLQKHQNSQVNAVTLYLLPDIFAFSLIMTILTTSF